MSVIHTPLSRQRFYRSLTLPCPYLPGKMESKLFTRLDEGNATALNALLTRAGFRRSHNIAYRPMCDDCNACQPVRVCAREFTPDRGQKRTLRHNADLKPVTLGAVATEEQYELFVRYQNARHAGGDMALMSYPDYTAMIEDCTPLTEVIEWRDGKGGLKAVMLADTVADGMSAVYSFFEPREPARSLGTFMILELLDEVLQRGRDYLYLGYLIDGLGKMDYKGRFRPLEGLKRDGWQVLGA